MSLSRTCSPGAVDIQVPEVVAKATERVTADKVADGVWVIAGGSHNSVAIEMKDHMILIEAPLGDLRSAPVIDEVKKLAPGKPIRFKHQSGKSRGVLLPELNQG